MTTETTPAGSMAVDIRSVIDAARLSGYQILLLVFCATTMFLDGYGGQLLAMAAPGLKAHIGLDQVQLGTIFAAGSLGSLVSAIAIFPFVDRIGRRPLIVGSLLVSGLFSYAFSFADSFAQLLTLRLAGGFFLSVAVTVTYSYSVEVAPKRLAATAVILSSTGFGLGVAASGFVSGLVIPAFGWRAIFYSGAACMIAFGLLMLWLLPESISVMALRSGRERQIQAFLRRVDPSRRFPESARYYLNEEKKPGLVFRNLLTEGRALPSLGIWLCIFLLNFVIFALMQWLPSMLADAGRGAGAAGAAIGWFKLGGVVGGFACAGYIDRRRNPYPVLTLCLAACCVWLTLVNGLAGSAALFGLLIFLCGFGLSGPQYSLNGLMARLFPTYVRTGGLAVYSAFARVGSMSGPFLAGVLLHAGWSNEAVFRAAIAPVLLAAAITVALGLRDWATHGRISTAASGAEA